jgi:hypothetical protein
LAPEKGIFFLRSLSVHKTTQNFISNINNTTMASNILTIEKTDFPFLNVEPQRKPKRIIRITCVGDMKFLQFLNLYYPYGTLDSYTHNGKDPSGMIYFKLPKILKSRSLDRNHINNNLRQKICKYILITNIQRSARDMIRSTNNKRMEPTMQTR